MNSIEILRLVIEWNLSEQSSIIHTPKNINRENKEEYAQWFFDVFHSNEVCIMDEDSDYLSIFVKDYECGVIDELDKLHLNWVKIWFNDNRYYFVKIE